MLKFPITYIVDVFLSIHSSKIFSTVLLTKNTHGQKDVKFCRESYRQEEVNKPCLGAAILPLALPMLPLQAVLPTHAHRCCSQQLALSTRARSIKQRTLKGIIRTGSSIHTTRESSTLQGWFYLQINARQGT